ncbi:hypothetical protein BSNK01_01510 [Bacillaceae bacterium]
MASGCIFCRIVAGELPAKKAYEDDEILAFHDINPKGQEVYQIHFHLLGGGKIQPFPTG